MENDFFKYVRTLGAFVTRKGLGGKNSRTVVPNCFYKAQVNGETL